MAVKEGKTPPHKSASVFILLGFAFGAIMFGGIAMVAANLEKQYFQKKLTGYETTIEEYVEKVSVLEDAVKKKDISVTPLIMKLRPQLDPTIAKEINTAIIKYSREFRLPPTFVLHLMKRESNFDTLAKSKAGAVGLMQVMPKAHKDKMKKIGITNGDLYHIDNNVRLGCWILREYFNKTGSIEKALKRYVGGNHATYANDILIGFTNTMIPRKELQKKE
jgi:soluble lytic murein transglycosylase-like protein